MHHIQLVERRIMLFAQLVGQEWQVTGTDGDDQIDVRYSDDGLNLVATLNGTEQTVRATDAFGINVAAGAGNDLVRVSAGRGRSVEIHGGQGNDQLFGAGNGESLFGDAGDDLLVGGSGDDLLEDGAGDDTLLGRAGDDTLVGGDGSDSMLAGNGNDSLTVLAPENGGDTALGEGGDDTFTIQDGSSTADGGSGADFFSVVGEGQPTLLGQSGNDIVSTSFPDVSPDDRDDDVDARGGSGTDTLLITGPFGVRVTLDNLANDGRAEDPDRAANIRSDFERLSGNVGNDYFDASAAPRGVFMNGAIGDDTLIGGAFADLLEGDDGIDSLVGNAGEDVLRGGGGQDTLTGGPGLDSFNGGKGNDLLNAADGEADTVNGAHGLGDSADIDELLDTLVRVESTT